MVILVRLFGIVIIVLGALFLVNPKAMRRYVGFWRKEKRIYAGGVLSLLFGIVFLVCASQCRIAWFVVTLGVLGLIKGVLLFVLGAEGLKPMFDWWQGRSDTFLRLYALLPLAFGILLIYSA